MADLDKWMGEANDLTAPKPLQMAKALRQRKVALANSPKAALAGGPLMSSVSSACRSAISAT